jgi:hypothetical protein
MEPGSPKLIGAHFISASVTAALAGWVISQEIDPYGYSFFYAFALMMLCTECWWFDDPKLANGTLTKGWPFFLFHAAGAEKTKAVIPQKPYTRVFSSWHAGGVCFSVFVHALAAEFPVPQKAQMSLALAMLWTIWACTNSVRVIYGGAQFCQAGIMFHSLAGPGCGLCGYWHFAFWLQNRSDTITSHEGTTLVIYGVLFVISVLSVALRGGCAKATAEI